jgi:hypothetical protein
VASVASTGRRIWSQCSQKTCPPSTTATPELWWPPVEPDVFADHRAGVGMLGDPVALRSWTLSVTASSAPGQAVRLTC